MTLWNINTSFSTPPPELNTGRQCRPWVGSIAHILEPNRPPAKNPNSLNYLNIDVRRLIWEEVRRLEFAEGRIVLFNRLLFNIIPTRSLVSPMLSINRESRECILEYFDIRLPLYNMRTVDSHYHQLFSREINWFNDIPREGWFVYISFKHDIFASGEDPRFKRDRALGFQDNVFAMTQSRILTLPDPNLANANARPRYTSPRHRVLPKYTTRSIWKDRHRIQSVIALFADEGLLTNHTPQCCPYQKRQFRKALVDQFWSEGDFPEIKRYLFYPWGPDTVAKVDHFLEYILEARYNRFVADEYKPRELVWGEKVEVTGRENVLMDPDIDENHRCICPWENNGIRNLPLIENPTIRQLARRMHQRASYRP